MVALLISTVSEIVEQLRTWIAESIACHLAVVALCSFALLYLVISVLNNLLSTEQGSPAVKVVKPAAKAVKPSAYMEVQPCEKIAPPTVNPIKKDKESRTTEEVRKKTAEVKIRKKEFVVEPVRKKKMTATQQDYSQYHLGSAISEPRNVVGNGLHGRIYVLSVFVSTTQRKWCRTTTRRMAQMVYEAEAWLKSQAARYCVHDVEFVNGEIGNCSDGTTIWQFHHPNNGDSIEYKMGFINSALSIAGYPDFYSLAHRECVRTGCQQFLVLCFLQSTGRSHAYFPWLHNGLTTSFTILYNWYQGEQLKVGTIAHEMLHLFGAWDLYKHRGFPVEKERVARVHYPDSIMIEDHTDDLSSREIDPVSAWRIGIGRGEQWFWYFAA